MHDTKRPEAPLDPRARAVLDWWFADAVANAAAAITRMPWWFGGDGEAAARDAECRERFGALLVAGARGELAGWSATPHGRLALIVVLDQFPRNVHRGTAAAFATDSLALAITLEGLAVGHDRALAPIERLFFYMPLQHAEDRAVQADSVARFGALATAAPPDLRATLEGAHEFAREHQAIVARFGRFPYRNALLGRESTAAELEWLRGELPAFGRSVAPPTR